MRRHAGECKWQSDSHIPRPRIWHDLGVTSRVFVVEMGGDACWKFQRAEPHIKWEAPQKGLF